MNIIIDTNIALNLWFFQDPSTLQKLSHLFQAQSSTQHTVYGTPAMLKELLRVAASPHLAKYVAANAQTLEHNWRQHVRCVDSSDATSPLRCRDVDDQMFLNLATQVDAQVIYTLDRDLLKLRKRASLLKLLITRP